MDNDNQDISAAPALVVGSSTETSDGPPGRGTDTKHRRATTTGSRLHVRGRQDVGQPVTTFDKPLCLQNSSGEVYLNLMLSEPSHGNNTAMGVFVSSESPDRPNNATFPPGCDVSIPRLDTFNWIFSQGLPKKNIAVRMEASGLRLSLQNPELVRSTSSSWPIVESGIGGNPTFWADLRSREFIATGTVCPTDEGSNLWERTFDFQVGFLQLEGRGFEDIASVGGQLFAQE